MPLHEELKGVGVGVDESWDLALATATRERGPHLSGFYDSVADYLALAATAAVRSPDPVVRALAMIDRRVGKRTLTSHELDGEPHPLVRRFRELRCLAEGWSVKRSSNAEPALE